MFSLKEKSQIASAVEKVLLEIKHTEKPARKKKFKLHIKVKESWSWADIEPNWTYNENNKPTTTMWNEEFSRKERSLTNTN